MGGYRAAPIVPAAPSSSFIGDFAATMRSTRALRRGKVVATSCGATSLVLVGDFLFSRSFQLMVAAEDIR
jgi:hypothetical protein